MEQQSIHRDYLIQTLHKELLPQMYSTFVEAFSGYSVRMRMKREQFDERVMRKLNIDFNLSAGAFSGQKLVGFIFHTLNDYKKIKVAYNGGTGVIEGHRGHGLTIRMYEYLFPLLKSSGAQACVLEVITTNEVAMRVYQQLGFEIDMLYHCFKLDPGRFNEHSGSSRSLFIEESESPTWSEYSTFADISTSFSDCLQQLQFNLKNEVFLHAKVDDQLVGYLIFQPALGRLSQIGVKRDMRRKGIGTALIKTALRMSKVGHLTAINIDADAHHIVNFFKSLGFQNQLDQYEMILRL